MVDRATVYLSKKVRIVIISIRDLCRVVIQRIGITEDSNTCSANRSVTNGSTGVGPSPIFARTGVRVRRRKRFKISKQNAPSLDYHTNDIRSGSINSPIRREEDIETKRKEALPLVLAATRYDACDFKGSVFLTSDATGSSSSCHVCFHNLSTEITETIQTYRKRDPSIFRYANQQHGERNIIQPISASKIKQRRKDVLQTRRKT